MQDPVNTVTVLVYDSREGLNWIEHWQEPKQIMANTSSSRAAVDSLGTWGA